jgi:hypothetical protein
LFFKTLTQQPYYKKGVTSFWLFIETNYGGGQRAAIIYRGVKKWALENQVVVHDIYEGKKDDELPGFWLTQQYKERMVYHALNLIDADQLKFHKDIVCSSLGKDPRVVLLEQMQNFRKIFKKEKMGSYMEEPKYSYSYSGKASGHNDDVLIAMLECIFFAELVTTDHRYMARAGRLPFDHSRGQFIPDDRGELVPRVGDLVESLADLRFASEREQYPHSSLAPVLF